MKVKDIMSRIVVYSDRYLRVIEAAKFMSRSRSRALIVIAEGVPIGIVTTGDIKRKVISKGFTGAELTVEDICTEPIITIGPEATVEEAKEIMLKNKIRHLPVVEGGRVVGITTKTNLLRKINRRPVPFHA
jgi:CBS domain-containing protein